jgi:hypothetical protein
MFVLPVDVASLALCVTITRFDAGCIHLHRPEDVGKKLSEVNMSKRIRGDVIHTGR